MFADMNSAAAMIFLYSEHPLWEVVELLWGIAVEYPGLAVFTVLFALLFLAFLKRLIYNCLFNDYHMGGDWKDGKKVR